MQDAYLRWRAAGQLFGGALRRGGAVLGLALLPERVNTFIHAQQHKHRETKSLI